MNIGMSKNLKLSVWVFLFFSSSIPRVSFSMPDEWELSRDQDGIQVYKREKYGSSFNEVRSITVIRSSLNRLVYLIKDPTLRPVWDQYCGQVYVYEKISDEEELVYLNSKMPWPVTDRDMLSRLTLTQDPNSLIVTVRSVATRGILPLHNDRIRVTEATSQWTLIPLGRGLVKISISTHLEPAGPIPSWLINILSVNSPFEALRRFRALATDTSIITPRVRFIKDRQDDT